MICLGDPGWVARARVPMVDNTEYVNRPTWQNNEDLTRIKRKGVRTRFILSFCEFSEKAKRPLFFVIQMFSLLNSCP